MKRRGFIRTLLAAIGVPRAIPSITRIDPRDASLTKQLVDLLDDLLDDLRRHGLQITASRIADGAITTAKISDCSVTSFMLANGVAAADIKKFS